MNIFQRWHQDNLQNKQLRIDTRVEYLASMYRDKIHSKRAGAERALIDIRNHERMEQRRRNQEMAGMYPGQRNAATRASVSFSNVNPPNYVVYNSCMTSFYASYSYTDTGARPPKKLPPKALENPNLPDI